jgi:dipeptidyl-peptidase-4
MLQKESEPIYRHSFLGKFMVKDLKSEKEIILYNGNYIQETRFSPDAKKDAYLAENNF